MAGAEKISVANSSENDVGVLRGFLSHDLDILRKLVKRYGINKFTVHGLVSSGEYSKNFRISSEISERLITVDTMLALGLLLESFKAASKEFARKNTIPINECFIYSAGIDLFSDLPPIEK